MKTVITVIGNDKPGIIACISSELALRKINILDVSQTIMDDYFTMVMLVDLSNSDIPFDEVKSRLLKKGNEVGVKVNMQREEIFAAMRTI